MQPQLWWGVGEVVWGVRPRKTRRINQRSTNFAAACRNLLVTNLNQFIHLWVQPAAERDPTICSDPTDPQLICVKFLHEFILILFTLLRQTQALRIRVMATFETGSKLGETTKRTTQIERWTSTWRSPYPPSPRCVRLRQLGTRGIDCKLQRTAVNFLIESLWQTIPTSQQSQFYQ
jgi:hypothetical protein